ncbi:MFS transporter [Mycobacterium sp. WMMD1722]|uniref:MFS transporter n=1 Tax=Mycobacterium sp. WMMD1722 TaxID=3404117 RepID=UPI003BF4E9E4
MTEVEHKPAIPRTVQEYIDERPVWADGTKTSSTPMTVMQWRIWSLASAGKFFEGMIVFMTGVALPLISREFGLNAFEKGMVTAASLAGILVGATVLGGLADTFGRKRMFIVEMILFVVFLVALTFAPNFILLVVFLVGSGLALGCDYPTAHMVISESIPTTKRGRLVLSAFAFQAVGALTGALVGVVILYENDDVGDWRWMYATAILPAILVIVGRFFITDSPHWLVSKGRTEEAERETARLLHREPRYPSSVTLSRLPERPDHRASGGYLTLFAKRNRRATILASVPWFLQDLSTYGIGIFTPTIIVAVLGADTDSHTLSGVIHNDMLAAEGSALMSVLFVTGVLAAILLVDTVGRIKLQTIGFLGCAAGLALAALSIRSDGGNNMILLFAGFMLFYFATNLGPNAMTYLLAGEVFPTPIRGRGAGFAASFAKVGAVLTAFLFPVLLSELGTTVLLYGLVAASVLGAGVTALFAIETRGLSLEKIGDPLREEHLRFQRRADADIA